MLSIISFLVLIVISFIIVLALCRISSLSDEEAEKIFENYLKQLKEKKQNGHTD